MSYETIRLEEEAAEGGDRFYVLTLDRPAVQNAINRKMVEEIGAALEVVAASQARALILTGAGGKAFAAGADIAELKVRGVGEALARINAGLFRRVEEVSVPTIAAIVGYALGGGCELAMACDVRIAGAGSKLGQPEVSLGIIPGAGALQRLPRLVGLGRAKELIFTGRMIDAAEAERIGLVNRVVADGEVLGEAKRMAGQIAKQGALAVRLAKTALNAGTSSAAAADAVDSFGQAVLFESPEKHARMQAFLDKRSAKQKGEQR